MARAPHLIATRSTAEPRGCEMVQLTPSGPGEDCERATSLTCGDTDSVLASPQTGETFTLRWVLAHMIEEHARHNGHADLIRRSVDGQSG